MSEITPPAAAKAAHQLPGKRTNVAPEVETLYAASALTPRKRRMVRSYVETGSYADAARASGYSPATVKKYLTTDTHVQRAVGQLVDQAALVTGVTLERVLNEYGRIAFSDIGELLHVVQAAGDGDAALAMLAEMPADITAAISSITYERKHDAGESGEYITGKLSLKFWDKGKALTDLGRMLSLFKDTLEVTDATAFGERLRRAAAKLADDEGSQT